MEQKTRALSIKKLSLRRRSRLGKYRLESRLGTGGYCEVWKAKDTIEGIYVALKIPLINSRGQRDNQTLLKEVKLVSQLRHPNILPVKNANIINGYAVMATEIGRKTLDDCSRPMSVKRIVNIISQVLSALAYAHQHRVVHCDVTPANIFLFPNDQALLGDFGIGLEMKGRLVTVDEFGTPGYVAPEQAYGKPTYRSDCFAVGLILYEFLSGVLPHWPYRWPFKGHDRLKQRTNLEMTRFLHQALMIEPERRFANAEEMLTAFHDALTPGILKKLSIQVPRRKIKDWQQLRRDAFINRYRRVFTHFSPCVKCGEPIAESMTYCPWCGTDRNRFDKRTSLDYICTRCKKGILPEWHY
ncbi:MAG: protein kinase, partial [Sedimentisphaerales bacterium]|nr:protein kinase [Sedimentisphaerales bacterium]